MTIASPSIQLIPIDDIYADDDFNCRGEIPACDVVELARNIQDNEVKLPETQGFIQPVVVSLFPPELAEKYGCKYQLIAGFRRRLACRVLNRISIPAIVQPYMSEGEARIVNMTENLNRKNLTLPQEAAAVDKLIGIYVGEELIAKKLGVSRGWVQIRVQFLKLPEAVRDEIVLHKISQPQIRDLYTIMTTRGVQAVFDSIGELKLAKSRGVKGKRLTKAANKVTTKRVRGVSEINDLIDHLRQVLPAEIAFGLHTIMLAWCTGAVTDGDMHRAVKDHAEENDCYTYTLPDIIEA